MAGSDGETLLKYCETGDIHNVESLLKNKVDVNYKNGSPLRAAAAAGNVEVVKMLWRFGATINLQDDWKKSALMLASENGHHETVKILVKHDAQVDLLASGESALMMASKNGQYETVKVLVENGAKVDLRDLAERSALMEASKYGHHETVKVLAERGAWVDRQDILGKSALMLASENGRYETVKVLVKHGAQVDLQGNSGETALMVASEFGQHETAKVLVDELGAQVNLQTNSGISALMIASDVGHIEVVKVLVERGARVNLKNAWGLTALDLARYDHDIQKVLLEKGAKKGVDVENLETSSLEPGKEGIPALKVAFRVLLSLSSEWYNIGVLLDVEDGVLRRIEHDRKKANDCLREMLEEWLKQTNPRPSWEILAAAVEPLDSNKAEEIRKIT